MEKQQPESRSDRIEAQQQYLLHSPYEIETVLRDLARRAELISVYFDEGKGYILTTLLSVLRERRLLVLEPGADPVMNQTLLQAERVNCIARHQDISVRFSSGPVSQARYQGQSVLVVPIPDSLFRLQRREYYRVNTPLALPLICQLQQADASLIRLPVADISAGGLALHDPTMGFEAEIGTLFKDSRLLIPDEVPLALDLRLCSVYMLGEEQHPPQLKLGFAYEKPAPETAGYLRRYVTRLQLKQSKGDKLTPAS
ncbi:MAG: flagellar brake protein [Chromatiales bacterium]|nr:flagellar brake protein [Gammaproteobacteria bacterium]MBW6476043.1 flagellar brake protein [Chromatiales bacterium]